MWSHLHFFPITQKKKRALSHRLITSPMLKLLRSPSVQGLSDQSYNAYQLTHATSHSLPPLHKSGSKPHPASAGSHPRSRLNPRSPLRCLSLLLSFTLGLHTTEKQHQQLI